MVDKKLNGNGSDGTANGSAAGNGQQPAFVHNYYYYEPKHARKERSSKPGIAGALLIITAVLGLIAGTMMLGSGFYMNSFDEDFEFWAGSDEGDVHGRVTFMNGTGVEGVTVSIVGEGMQVTTDADGYYWIYNVPAGNTEVRVQKAGYNTYIKKVMVTPFGGEWVTEDNNMDDNNEYDFVMTEGSSEIERGEYPDWDVISSFVFVCSSLVIVFAVLALVGGYFAIKRKSYGFAVLGAVLGLFTLIGAIFALVALIILAISKDEFKRGGNE